MKRLPKTLLVCALASGLLLTVTGCGTGVSAPSTNPPSPARTVAEPCGCTVDGAFTEDGGTATAPWLISTAEQLDHVREHLNAHYKLENDIDLTDYLEGSEYGWMSLGSRDIQRFTGNFDGAGHVISGLTVTQPGNISSLAYNTGLFGTVGEKSTISNLGVESSGISSGFASSHGILAGVNYGRITDCFVNGSINVDGSSCIGGFVGWNTETGEIVNCYALVDVTGGGNVGGLVGLNWGSITNSYATGTVVSSGNCTGGLVGLNSGGELSNCYAIVTVSSEGEGFTGGLAGTFDDTSEISNCYAVGTVTTDTDVSGGSGFVSNLGGSTITNSYWNTDANAYGSWNEYADANVTDDTDENEDNIENAFENGYTPSMGNPIGMTFAEMCTPEFAATLNTVAGSGGAWAQDDAIQNGLPYLTAIELR